MSSENLHIPAIQWTEKSKLVKFFMDVDENVLFIELSTYKKGYLKSKMPC